ncbi:cupin domain-containing protein [Pedobacter petrophilus]|uniref:Cupin domain-containing protein n=1 Tax=Pedobacter petrophilus TaxID=1908241 RepID=A0A7K0G0Y5_9SPHI|nr:cupin domain-containing protein [Pedobacter petrophilus]MRX76994.1 cupin domain-containing protein [Pedobacter petrophilus]
MKKIALIILAMCAGFVTAHAQHDSKSVNVTKTPAKVIFKQLINTTDLKNQEITVIVVTIAPGEVSGAHIHPIPTVGYVLEGEVEMNFNGKTHRFKQGDAFYEVPNQIHKGTKNLNSTKDAKLLVYFIGPKGKPFIAPAH